MQVGVEEDEAPRHPPLPLHNLEASLHPQEPTDCKAVRAGNNVGPQRLIHVRHTI